MIKLSTIISEIRILSRITPELVNRLWDIIDEQQKDENGYYLHNSIYDIEEYQNLFKDWIYAQPENK